MSALIPAGSRVHAWKQQGGFLSWDVSDEVTPRQAMVAAGLDTPVEKHPIYSHDGTPIKNKAETWRDGAHVGIVGKDTYEIKPFEYEALPLIERITLESPMRVQAAGKYAHGARELMVLAMPDDLLVGGQPFNGFMWFTNSHDGSSAFTLSLEEFRASCTNQAPKVNRAATLRIRHRKGGVTAEDARRILGISLKYREDFAQKMLEELSVPFTPAQYEKFVLKTAPVRDEHGHMKTGRGLTMARNAQDALWASYRADDLNDVRRTLFGATQASYAYYDWAYSSDKSRGLRSLSLSTEGQKIKARETLAALV
jgi:hypothetical protein